MSQRRTCLAASNVWKRRFILGCETICNPIVLVLPMSKELTIGDARESLNAHVAAKGGEIRLKYGPQIGWQQLLRLLEDRSCVRYPCEIVFDVAPLQEGELAYPLARGTTPEEGFTIYVHPYFAAQLARVPGIVLYQLAVVNYGDFASTEDAEVFGSCALGISKDDYYMDLCRVADEIENQ
jgi:hypothetical protein